MTNTNKNVKYYKYTKKKYINKDASQHTIKTTKNTKTNNKKNNKKNTNVTNNTKQTIKQKSKLQNKKHKSHNINDELKFILEEAHSITLVELNKYKLSYFKDQQCILDNINKLYKS